jgi:Uma2 family endonuclease
MVRVRRLRRKATWADLERVPETMVGEIIDDVLYTFPRPVFAHADVEGYLVGDLKNPFQRGKGGPGGWWILNEPGINLPGAPEIVPDLAGWRKERMPVRPEGGRISTVPDWVCEILSPSTRNHDIDIKRPFYARVGVAFMWYVDIDNRSVQVNKLVDGHWVELANFVGDERKMRAEPFEVVAIDLREWWGTRPEPKRAKKPARKKR